MASDDNGIGNFCPPPARSQVGLLASILLWLWPPCWEAGKCLDIWINLVEDMLSQRTSLPRQDFLVLWASLFNRFALLHTSQTYFIWSSRKRKGKKQNEWWFLHFLPKNIQDFVTTNSRKQAMNLPPFLKKTPLQEEELRRTKHPASWPQW